MTGIAGNYRLVLERIRNAAARAGRSADSIRVIAVTKTVSADRVREAAACGIKHFGENRVQEALPKREALASLGLTWHFIGRLQTNKAKKVAENFDCVHSVDRLEAGEALARYVADRPPLPVLIEVKLEDEPNKSGAAEADLPKLVTALRHLGNLRLEGFMVIPPPVEDPEDARPYFRRLRKLAEEFELPELSMGMTHDFEIAVEEGATMVRIGTGLFGARP